MIVNNFYLFLAVLGLSKPAFDFIKSDFTIVRINYGYVAAISLLISYVIAYALETIAAW